MEHPVFELNIKTLEDFNTADLNVASLLEKGHVIFLPNFPFMSHALKNPALLSPNILDGKHKNLSFDIQTKRLGGCHQKTLYSTLSTLMEDYALFSEKLISTLCPPWKNTLKWGRTSYRPSEVKGRITSKRKDDTKLHVDAFSATPVHGQRILRVFSNINPMKTARTWELGEPFDDVIAYFSKQLPSYQPHISTFLKLLKLTKTKRSAYDHYQLALHHAMKEDDYYQQNTPKIRFEFPAESTWIVFTDQVSHAALSGQFLMEQTFYLPVCAMEYPETSPFEIWKKEKKDVFSESILESW